MKLFHLDPFRVFGLLALMLVLSLPFENEDAHAPNQVPPASPSPKITTDTAAAHIQRPRETMARDPLSEGSLREH